MFTAVSPNIRTLLTERLEAGNQNAPYFDMCERVSALIQKRRIFTGSPSIRMMAYSSASIQCAPD